MANNTFQVRRTSVAGRTPNTTSSANSQYINPGELGLNMTDRILYSSDGTNLLTIGANLVNQSVSNVISVGNSTVNTTINSTTFSGVANNAAYLGGTIASGYQTTAGMSGNVASILLAGIASNANFNGQVFITNNGVPLTVSNTSAGLVTVQANGSLSVLNNVIAFASDVRLKEDITPIKNALQKLHKIRGVTYKHNDLARSFGLSDQPEFVGVIAQEVQKVLPQVIHDAPFDIKTINGVSISKSGQKYLTVEYDKIVPLLIEAVKELSNEVKRLKKLVGE